MDRLIYQAMTGAKALMQRQDALSNNLANANSDGFRADLLAFRAVPIRAEGSSTTRVYSLEATAGFDPNPGPVLNTGRALDVAIKGSGWMAVQTRDGSEAYTRAGALEITGDGVLQTKFGLPVLSDSGPITIPPNSEVTIGSDGLVSAKVAGQPAQSIGTIKLVDPDVATLRKAEDGLMRPINGDVPVSQPTVSLTAGALEGSNVNVVESMVGMIALARQFDMQMRMLQNAEQNSQRAAQLLAPAA
jgi:flagellar basal-body rod protein FlgF